MEIHLCNFLIIESNRSNTIDAIAQFYKRKKEFVSPKCCFFSLLNRVCFVFECWFNEWTNGYRAIAWQLSVRIFTMIWIDDRDLFFFLTLLSFFIWIINRSLWFLFSTYFNLILLFVFNYYHSQVQSNSVCILNEIWSTFLHDASEKQFTHFSSFHKIDSNSSQWNGCMWK